MHTHKSNNQRHCVTLGRSQFDITDWLASANVSQQTVKTFEGYSINWKPATPPQATPMLDIDISTQKMWDLSEASFGAQHKSIQSEFTASSANITIYTANLQKRGRKPSTSYDHHQNSICVVLPEQRSTYTLLKTAHEYAHAVNYCMTGAITLHPMQRETCAFLGELYLIDYLQTKAPLIYQALKQLWQHENKRYIDYALPRLIKALRHQGTPYHYTWNYPLSRMLAIHIYLTGDKLCAQELFTQSKSLNFRRIDLDRTRIDNPFSAHYNK